MITPLPTSGLPKNHTGSSYNLKQISRWLIQLDISPLLFQNHYIPLYSLLSSFPLFNHFPWGYTLKIFHAKYAIVLLYINVILSSKKKWNAVCFIQKAILMLKFLVSWKAFILMWPKFNPSPKRTFCTLWKMSIITDSPLSNVFFPFLFLHLSYST